MNNDLFERVEVNIRRALRSKLEPHHDISEEEYNFVKHELEMSAIREEALRQAKEDIRNGVELDYCCWHFCYIPENLKEEYIPHEHDLSLHGTWMFCGSYD